MVADRAADWALPVVACGTTLRPEPVAEDGLATEWVLFTSGTTGRPKLVMHDLTSLLGPLSGTAPEPGTVWATFYDIRRYGGLTVLLRGLLGGAMVLAGGQAGLADFAMQGVTHVSGTPSHWHRALMRGDRAGFHPRTIRLSGETAGQATLDRLAAAFPSARVVHAFATTEAGLAFEVSDGLAGFPASLLDQQAPVALRVVDGTLRVASPRTARRYFGGPDLLDADGFVDTGDLIGRADGRCHFLGRREGVINVGGQKVFPEEVEAVINRHPGVRLSRVRARPNPVLGAVVAAEVVAADAGLDAAGFVALREAILRDCRARLAPHKVPASLRAVADLPIAASGKLERRDA